MPILVGIALDLVYQIIVHRWVYPLEMVFTVTLLVLVPYVLLRGPVNRLAFRFSRKGSAPAGTGAAETSPTVKH